MYGGLDWGLEGVCVCAHAHVFGGRWGIDGIAKMNEMHGEILG